MEIYQNHPLAPHTTVKIGGPADTFIITNTTSEFIEVLKGNMDNAANEANGAQRAEAISRKESSTGNSFANYPQITILGNGSNTLISDSGIRGTVIKNQANSIKYLAKNLVKVDSGVQLPFLITDSINHSLCGLEEFAYIPSTIGGAIFGNIHGVNKNNFNKFITEIKVFDLKTNSLINFSTNKLTWSYDSSEFQQHPNWVILSATLQLSPGDKQDSNKLVSDIIAHKSLTQSLNSLGSVFKNPSNDSAGRIIDQDLNLKGFKIGNAQISPLHANFIINLGDATAADYFAVIKKVQSEAKLKLNITLDPEIKFLGNFY